MYVINFIICSEKQTLWTFFEDMDIMDIRSNGYPRNWAGAVGPQLSPADNLFIFLTQRQQEADSLLDLSCHQQTICLFF